MKLASVLITSCFLSSTITYGQQAKPAHLRGKGRRR